MTSVKDQMLKYSERVWKELERVENIKTVENRNINTSVPKKSKNSFIYT